MERDFKLPLPWPSWAEGRGERREVRTRKMPDLDEAAQLSLHVALSEMGRRPCPPPEGGEAG